MILVELILAAAILAVAALGLAASVPSAYSVSEGTRNEEAGRRALVATIADIEATPFAEAAVRYHVRGFAIPGLSAAPDDADGLPGEIMFAPAPGGVPDCYQITIRVRWKDVSGVRTIEEVRLVANVRDDPGTPVPLATLEQFHGAGNGYFPGREYFYR